MIVVQCMGIIMLCASGKKGILPYISECTVRSITLIPAFALASPCFNVLTSPFFDTCTTIFIIDKNSSTSCVWQSCWVRYLSLSPVTA